MPNRLRKRPDNAEGTSSTNESYADDVRTHDEQLPKAPVDRGRDAESSPSYIPNDSRSNALSLSTSCDSSSAPLWGAFNVLIFNIIVFLMSAAHIRAVMSDPGIVPLPKTSLDFSDMHSGKQQMSDGWSVCTKCETYRPPRAHHCRICERCIRRMDHHCPWINNCVGEYNQRYFMQFLFYVGLAAVHATTMVIVSWMLDPGVKGDFKHLKLVHSIILVIECLLFGLFVIAIGCDQLSAIFNDETGVEYVKKEGLHRNHSKMLLLREVFGPGHPATWLFPLMDNSRSDKRTMDNSYTV